MEPNTHAPVWALNDGIVNIFKSNYTVCKNLWAQDIKTMKHRTYIHSYIVLRIYFHYENRKKIDKSLEISNKKKSTIRNER